MGFNSGFKGLIPKKIRGPNIVYIHTEGNPVQIETLTHWNLIGHCVVELRTGTTLSYIFFL